MTLKLIIKIKRSRIIRTRLLRLRHNRRPQQMCHHRQKINVSTNVLPLIVSLQQQLQSNVNVAVASATAQRSVVGIITHWQTSHKNLSLILPLRQSGEQSVMIISKLAFPLKIMRLSEKMII